MFRLFFLVFVFFAYGGHAAEVILPAALPDDATEEGSAAPINKESKDIFEGTVLPNPVPLAAANTKNTPFEFAAITDDSMNTEKKADSKPISTSPFIPSPIKKAEDKTEELWLDSMRKALIAKGVGDKVEVEGVRYGHRLEEAKANPTRWFVQDVTFDSKTNHFSGKLVATNEESIPFRGRYGVVQMVPVLKNRLNKGATIAATDIELQPVLSARIDANNTVTDPKQLIGKTLGRMVTIGMPLRTHDLVLPIVVTLNSEVEMTYSGGGIEVSDRGVALEKGAVGEVIRVKNSKSGAMVRARVEGPHSVSVSYFVTPTKGEHYAAK